MSPDDEWFTPDQIDRRVKDILETLRHDRYPVTDDLESKLYAVEGLQVQVDMLDDFAAGWTNRLTALDRYLSDTITLNEVSGLRGSNLFFYLDQLLMVEGILYPSTAAGRWKLIDHSFPGHAVDAVDMIFWMSAVAKESSVQWRHLRFLEQRITPQIPIGRFTQLCMTLYKPSFIGEKGTSMKVLLGLLIDDIPVMKAKWVPQESALLIEWRDLTVDVWRKRHGYSDMVFPTNILIVMESIAREYIDAGMTPDLARRYLLNG